jgi:uncharacterized protein YbaP (TraB family)
MHRPSPIALACAAALGLVLHAQAASCVWKVSAPDGKTLYLGGSVHALHKSDYPLPQPFLRAFDASSHLAFEVDAKALQGTTKSLVKAGQYPKGDSLTKHVDPRTYAYVRRVFDLLNIPEENLQRARPWLIVLMLQSLSMRGLSSDLGVDQFLMNKAKGKGKPVIGLETVDEHARIYSGLSDRQAEILLLVAFLPSASGGGDKNEMMSAWRRGDAEALAAMTQASFREFPAFGQRLLDERNRAWVPKIEGFLRSGRTYFVVVGSAHLGGAQGLLPLLRSRGYELEQL